MIAAIYARKSTDQCAVADKAKSVTRQIAHADCDTDRAKDGRPVERWVYTRNEINEIDEITPAPAAVSSCNSLFRQGMRSLMPASSSPALVTFRGGFVANWTVGNGSSTSRPAACRSSWRMAAGSAWCPDRN